MTNNVTATVSRFPSLANTSWQRAMSESLAAGDLFTDDEYGLLNAAKFASALANGSVDGSTDGAGGGGVAIDASNVSAYVVTGFPSRYSSAAVAILAAVMTAMMVVIVVGNLLVVIAIFTENNLTGVQNWFIASLAVADMLIGLAVMPFSLAYELMGYWMFGELWCEIHGAMDVLLCTASIMNICLISLDRYWSITRAVNYMNKRTPQRVTIMIMTIWALSALICFPPLLGWKQDHDMEWFYDLLAVKDERNLTQAQFLDYVDTSGHMDLHNFTITLETVVYPQCGVSLTLILMFLDMLRFILLAK